MANFVNYANAQALMTAIGNKFSALNGAYVFKGNSTFANLPATPTEAMSGYVYNVTTDFTTDARFVEGAGKKYPAGTNVAIADLSTYEAVTPAGSENPSSEGWYELVDGKYVLSTDETVDSEKTYYAKTVSVKYDVMGAFIDVDALNDAIQAVSNMIAAEFDETNAYAIGDLAVHEGALYKFTSAHTADDPWSASEVTGVTVDDLLDLLQANINTVSTNLTNVREMISDDNFDETTAYETGDIVVYQNGLYKFKADHAAGAWTGTDVDEVTVIDLIQAAEPDALTTAQVNALIALLG